MRTAIAITAAAGLLLTLAGCTVSAPSGACEIVPDGDASSTITASGAFGAEPTVTFPTPLATDTLEVSVLEKGDGPVVQEGDLVSLTYTVFDPVSGEQASATTPGNIMAGGDLDAERLLECATVGSRLAAVLPGSEATDTEAATLTAVVMIDIDAAYHTRATGRIEMPAAGMPSVVTAPNGQPGITILDEAPPTSLKYSTLITGDGKKVAEGDRVLLQQTVINWDTKSVVTSSWTSGAPQARTLTRFDQSSGDGLSAGAVTALSGKTVGSQVLVVMPPSTWAGSDLEAATGATLVAVYDILAILE